MELQTRRKRLAACVGVCAACLRLAYRKLLPLSRGWAMERRCQAAKRLDNRFAVVSRNAPKKEDANPDAFILRSQRSSDRAAFVGAGKFVICLSQINATFFDRPCLNVNKEYKD